MTEDGKGAERVTFSRGYDVCIMAIDGTWRRDCQLNSISDTDATLTVEGSIQGLNLKEFFLLLSSTGLAYRRCELVRVNGTEMDIQLPERQARQEAAGRLFKGRRGDVLRPDLAARPDTPARRRIGLETFLQRKPAPDLIRGEDRLRIRKTRSHLKFRRPGSAFHRSAFGACSGRACTRRAEQSRRQLVHFDVAIVPQQQAIVRTEHAKAAAHIVERRVQFLHRRGGIRVRRRCRWHAGRQTAIAAGG